MTLCQARAHAILLTLKCEERENDLHITLYLGINRVKRGGESVKASEKPSTGELPHDLERHSRQHRRYRYYPKRDSRSAFQGYVTCNLVSILMGAVRSNRSVLSRALRSCGTYLSDTSKLSSGTIPIVVRSFRLSSTGWRKNPSSIQYFLLNH